MKDYGNAGALCGALGCMVLLIVSMHFAKSEDKPKAESASAEVVFDEENGNTAATTVSSGTEMTGMATDISGSMTETDISDTDISGDVSAEETSETTTTAVKFSAEFIGPLSKEALEAAKAVHYEPEVMHQVYPQQLSIVGDSIASGFGVYQVLDNPYDFAVGNMGSWSVNDYTFEYEGQSGVYNEVLAASQPGYIYISMGMNDVNMVTSDQYVENYRQIITSVREACPDSNIIVAGITPIAAGSTFAANSTINMFNEKLKTLVDEFASDTIRYYDAGSYITDEATGGLKSDCDGGDGIHLSYSAYYMLLENLYPLLDEMPVPPSVAELIEEQGLDDGTGEDADTESDTEPSTENDTAAG